MSEFIQRLEREIQGRALLSRRQKILVAVSGGLDSMVLLHALNALAKKNRWKIFVAHFNHQLRGRSSDADEKLAKKTAEKLGLPFVAGRADVKHVAKESKISVEMAARKSRHEFFAKAARERKISIVALAHHADDQVELFFLRVLRGAGGEGLAGMKWRSPSPADKKINLVRPLLGFSKTEVLAFARAGKIPFREDASNFSNDFLRNRIRNELLPLLREKYQPGLSKAVLRLMEIVGAESDAVGHFEKNWLKHRQPVFEKLSAAIQRRVLQSQLIRLKLTPDFELIESLRRAANVAFGVDSKFSIARDAAGNVRLKKYLPAAEFKRDELTINLAGRAGDVKFGEVGLIWQFETSDKNFRRRKKSAREFFDAEKVGAKIILRHWRPGDRFQPIGMQSAAKLQDLFTNAKIPRERRRDLIVAVAARGEIFWVEGLRISEKLKLTALTTRCLVWRWRRPKNVG